MDVLHIVDLEAAINLWRTRAPSQAGAALSPAVAALAEVYARMAVERRDTVDASTLTDAARAAWLAWYDTTLDTPCIAICSTNQGDAVCKGCGRTEDEVRHWLSLSPFAKRDTWHRITQAQTAWRFTRYAERARDVASVGPVPPPARGPVIPARQGLERLTRHDAARGHARRHRGDGVIEPGRRHQRSPRLKPASPATGSGRAIPAMARSMVRIRASRSSAEP